MLSAWRLGADGGGIFYYLIGRVWALVFGSSAMALRLLNALAMWVALAFLWIAARRYYRLEIVAFSLPFCWLTSSSILQQLMIGRFYGLLMASVASVILAYALASNRRVPSVLSLLAAFASNSLLVGAHPTGIIYSLALLLAIIAFDLAHKAPQPRLYLAAIAGCWILIPSRTALIASAAVTKPHFWTTVPNIFDLCDALFFWTPEMEAVIITLIVCLVARWVWLRRSPSRPRTLHTDTFPLLFGATLVSVIPVLWLKSQNGTSYFVDRYLTPTILGAALLMCAALHRLIPAQRPRVLSIGIALAALAAAGGTVYSAVWDFPSFFVFPPHRYTDTIAAVLPHDRPIVIERVDVFAETVFETPGLPAYYLLDWPSVSSPESLRSEISGYHEMQNWKRAGYYSSAIQPSDTFLSQQDDFLVIADPRELWFARYIQDNPAFTAEKVREVRREGDTETVWHVRRIH